MPQNLHPPVPHHIQHAADVHNSTKPQNAKSAELACPTSPGPCSPHQDLVQVTRTLSHLTRTLSQLTRTLFTSPGPCPSLGVWDHPSTAQWSCSCTEFSEIKHTEQFQQVEKWSWSRSAAASSGPVPVTNPGHCQLLWVRLGSHPFPFPESGREPCCPQIPHFALLWDYINCPHCMQSAPPALAPTSLPQQSCRGVSVGSAPSCCFRNRKTLDVFPPFGAIPAPCSPRCFCCARHCGSPGLECFSGFPSHQTPQISIWEWSLSVQFIPHICLLTHA